MSFGRCLVTKIKRLYLRKIVQVRFPSIFWILITGSAQKLSSSVAEIHCLIQNRKEIFFSSKKQASSKSSDVFLVLQSNRRPSLANFSVTIVQSWHLFFPFVTKQFLSDLQPLFSSALLQFPWFWKLQEEQVCSVVRKKWNANPSKSWSVFQTAKKKNANKAEASIRYLQERKVF